jgi:hypothetical protein
VGFAIFLEALARAHAGAAQLLVCGVVVDAASLHDLEHGLDDEPAAGATVLQVLQLPLQ